MLLPEVLRWAAVAAIVAAFWSLDAGRPLVLARVPARLDRFRAARPA